MSVYRTIGPLVGICSRSQVSVYRTIGPLVEFFAPTKCPVLHKLARIVYDFSKPWFSELYQGPVPIYTLQHLTITPGLLFLLVFRTAETMLTSLMRSPPFIKPLTRFLTFSPSHSFMFLTIKLILGGSI